MTGPQRVAELCDGSLESVLQAVREKVLETHADLVMKARMSRDKRSEVVSLIQELIVAQNLYVPKLSRKDLAEKIAQELFGLGPIDDLLEDEDVTEIMVNGPQQVYVEKQGKIVRTPVAFKDENHLLDIINRIIQGAGRRIDRSMPYVDARLSDGSRVNAIIPPLSVSGPILTIRRFPKRYKEYSELIALGTMTQELAEFLERAVRSELDIVVSGGSSTGKTTTLNVLAQSIPQDERIIVIEDSSEIKIVDHHVINLEARPQNVEGRGEVTIRDLLRNALRMRPDRLIIGECRGRETFDLITAMNTGHEGCLATVHANSSEDCLDRLCGMALMAEENVPLAVLKTWIAIGVDLVVQQSKTPNGSRIVSEVSLVGREKGKLSSRIVYTAEKGFLLKDPPEWFVEKIGLERASSLFEPLYSAPAVDWSEEE